MITRKTVWESLGGLTAGLALQLRLDHHLVEPIDHLVADPCQAAETGDGDEMVTNPYSVSPVGRVGRLYSPRRWGMPLSALMPASRGPTERMAAVTGSKSHHVVAVAASPGTATSLPSSSARASADASDGGPIAAPSQRVSGAPMAKLAPTRVRPSSSKPDATRLTSSDSRAVMRTPYQSWYLAASPVGPPASTIVLSSSIIRSVSISTTSGSAASGPTEIRKTRGRAGKERTSPTSSSAPG